MFDYEVMKRFGIKESALPKGSIILNRKMSVWEQYWGWLLGIVLIGGLQTFFILALLAHGKKLRAANAALRESEEAFSKLFEESSNPILLMDGNRFIACNQATLKFLGIHDKDSFLNSTPEDISPRFQPDGTLSSESAAKYNAQAYQEGYCRFEWQCLRTDQVPLLLEVALMPMIIKGQRLLYITWLDITDRKRAEEELCQEEARLRKLVEIVQCDTTDTKSLLDIALDKCLELTGSRFGYIYHYDEDSQSFTLNSWSRDVMQACSIAKPDTCYELSKTGIWGEAVRQRSAIIVNDFKAAHPLKKGYPEGHASLTSFMTVPIVINSRIVAVVGVANKQVEYTDRDVLQLTLLMDATWRVLERRRAEESLRGSEERLALALQASNDGLWDWDISSGVIYFSPRYYMMLGFQPGDFPCSFDAWKSLLHPDDVEKTNQEISRKLGTSEPFEVTYRMQTKSGEWAWILARGKLVEKNAQGCPKRVVGTHVDITDRKLLEEQLLFRALHDPLTGLANRTLCLDRIAQANERANRNQNNTFSVVFMDLDHFKVINDSLGHEVGDQALKEVAKRLLACARRVDTVCRYGGDEYILVLEGLTPRQAIKTMKRVRKALETPLCLNEHEILVGASFGITHAPQGNCQAEDIIRNANIALHQAKKFGRNKAIVYRSGMHEAVIHTLSLQNEMRTGLAANEFFMVYQPIFRMGSNRLAGFEALVRWHHPQRGIVSPVEFIPLAEESGFIFELGNYALLKACRDMVDLLRDLPAEDHLTVSVNFSPRQFSRPGLAEQVDQALVSTGLPPSCLVIEITESSIMKHPEASAHILARLKEKGVGIAIDDFGVGYSSMSTLQKLPLDRLKIDMSFVKRMMGSVEDREIVRAIIMLARSLNLKTVAEGIETEEQRVALDEMHCDLGQGFLCSRPMPLGDVPQAIRLMVCTREK